MLVYETPKNVPETLMDRRAGPPGRRLSMHSKKLRLTWSANHLVRGGASDHFPCVLGVLNFNTSTLQHLNTSIRRCGKIHFGETRNLLGLPCTGIQLGLP